MNQGSTSSGTKTVTGFSQWIQQNVPDSFQKNLTTKSIQSSGSPPNYPASLASDVNASQVFDRYETDILSTLSQGSSYSGNENVLEYAGQLMGNSPNLQINSLTQLKATLVRCAVITYLSQEGGGNQQVNTTKFS